MKPFFFYLLASTLTLASCQMPKKPQPVQDLKVAQYADSNEFAVLKMSADLPFGNDDVSRKIRDSLFDVIQSQLNSIPQENGDSSLRAFKGRDNDGEKFMKYYGDQVFRCLVKNAEKQNTFRKKTIAADKSLSKQEKRNMTEKVMQWNYEMSIKKIGESDRYVVYLSQDYEYFGGAHGAITGVGPMTFSLKDGRCITKFIKDDSVEKMQPILREGLKSYFAEEGQTFTDEDLKDKIWFKDKPIPMPTLNAYPSDSGLVLTYRQYEVASYADGMPTFTVPYSKIKPFLTDEAKKLLELQ